MAFHAGINHAHGVTSNGPFGVMLFFLLSGFLMGYLHINKPWTWRNVANYSLARIARVVPAYYLAIFVAAQLGQPHSTTVKELVCAYGNLPWQPYWTLHLWTVSVEMQWYAIFILLWGLHSCGWSRSVAVACVAYYVADILYEGPWLPRSFSREWYGTCLRNPYCIVNYCPWFLAGTTIGASWDSVNAWCGRHSRWVNAAAPVLAVATLANAFMIPGKIMEPSTHFVPPFERFPLLNMRSDHKYVLAKVYWNYWAPNNWILAVGILITSAYGASSTEWLLNSPVAQFCGKISYGLYLYHFMIAPAYISSEQGKWLLDFITRHCNCASVTSAWQYYLIVFASALVLAACSFFFFETGVGRAIRGLGPGNSRNQGTPSVTVHTLAKGTLF
jgi:peptidoglycan/LPS O-acetylase OafA/YrhL